MSRVFSLQRPGMKEDHSPRSNVRSLLSMLCELVNSPSVVPVNLGPQPTFSPIKRTGIMLTKRPEPPYDEDFFAAPSKLVQAMRRRRRRKHKSLRSMLDKLNAMNPSAGVPGAERGLEMDELRRGP